MLNEPLYILAGGLGTRLRSVVSSVPKPLAPVHGKPFLQYLIEDWLDQGAADFVFLVHYQAELIGEFVQALFATEPFRHCRARIVVEPALLGTGGAVANAIAELGYEGTLMLVNADTWLPGALLPLANSVVPAMAVVEVDSLSRYGGVKIKDDRVTRFVEKGSSGAGQISAGLYRLRTMDFPQTGQAYSLERDILPNLASTGQLNAVTLDCPFIDIGIPEDYSKFVSSISSRARDN
jgi:D-glycero-alpha-D-manno-heptose 1-phosphate guanylyltransferase